MSEGNTADEVGKIMDNMKDSEKEQLMNDKLNEWGAIVIPAPEDLYIEKGVDEPTEKEPAKQSKPTGQKKVKPEATDNGQPTNLDEAESTGKVVIPKDTVKAA